jgi:hypothetical protein
MVFWLDMHADEFELPEVAEFAALIRGTEERITSARIPSICISGEKGDVEVRSIYRVCELVEEKLRRLSSRPWTERGISVQFVYPMIYVCRVAGCRTAEDILLDHNRTIAGLLNIWLDNTDSLKAREANVVRGLDWHPFDYGVTCLTSVLALELHPSNLEDIAKRRGIGLDGQHRRERTFLSFLCEVPVAQRFIMMCFDEDLSAMQQESSPEFALPTLNPIRLMKMTLRVLRVSQVHADISRTMRQFRTVLLTRKTYMTESVDALRRSLGTERIEAGVDRVLRDIQRDTEVAYSMLTTMFVIILTIAGTLAGIVASTVAVVLLLRRS